MNKKAGYAQPIVDVFATIVIILILIAFFVLFKMHTNSIDVKISGDVQEVDSENMLLAYLRMPIEYEDKNTTMGALLDKTDAKEIIEKESKKYLQNIMFNTGCAIKIKIQGTQKITIQHPLSGDEPRCNKKAPHKAKQVVPGLNQNIEVLLSSDEWGWEQIAQS